MIPLPSLSTSIDPVSAALDAATTDEKVNWMRGLGKKELVALWTLTEGREVPLDYYHRGPGEVVIHEGQNSLAAFNQFQKRIVLHGTRIQGYNHQAMAWLTGPGHFQVTGDAVGTWFDYTVTVPDAPAEFPPVKPNDAGLSRLVYANMIDRVRRIGTDTVIGAAWKSGKQTGDYFMLVKR
jgi:hypothetical protein